MLLSETHCCCIFKLKQAQCQLSMKGGPRHLRFLNSKVISKNIKTLIIGQNVGMTAALSPQQPMQICWWCCSQKSDMIAYKKSADTFRSDLRNKSVLPAAWTYHSIECFAWVLITYCVIGIVIVRPWLCLLLLPGALAAAMLATELENSAGRDTMLWIHAYTYAQKCKWQTVAHMCYSTHPLKHFS